MSKSYPKGTLKFLMVESMHSKQSLKKLENTFRFCQLSIKSELLLDQFAKNFGLQNRKRIKITPCKSKSFLSFKKIYN